jgi:hypothetical protein
MSLKSRPDGLDQKLILMRKQKTMGDGKFRSVNILKVQIHFIQFCLVHFMV